MQTYADDDRYSQPENVTSNRGEMDDGEEEPWEGFGGKHSGHEDDALQASLGSFCVNFVC
jgi:hypothetical protein